MPAGLNDNGGAALCMTALTNGPIELAVSGSCNRPIACLGCSHSPRKIIMYNPKAFAVEDLPQLHAMMGDCRLAVLITQGEPGLQPRPMPLLLDTPKRPHGSLYGHLARHQHHPRAPTAGAQTTVICAADAAQAR